MMLIAKLPEKEPDSFLVERAVATSWLLIDTFDQWVGEIWKEYQLQGAEILGFERHWIVMTTYRRILVELLCWAAYSLYQEVLQEHLTKSRMLFLSEPDPERIEEFQALLLEDLSRHLGPYIADIREVQVATYHPFKLGYGDPLSIEHIMSLYAKSSSMAMAQELFTERLAFAVDPYLINSSRKLAKTKVERVQEAAQAIVVQVFSSKAPLQVIEGLAEEAKPVEPQNERIPQASYGRSWRFASAW